MKQKSSLFSYKQGNSFIHRCPPELKLLVIPVLNILLLFLPWIYSLIFAVAFLAAGLFIKITLKEIITDIKPVLYYAFLLFIFELFTLDFSSFEIFKLNFINSFSWTSQKETVFFLLKLFCIMLSSSLLFKTSTSLELRSGISKIETAVRKIMHSKKENTFTQIIFLFLNFIPMFAKIFEQLKKSWKARMGKPGIKMYLKLLPVMFSVSIKKAWNMSRALEIRRMQGDFSAA